MCWIALQVQAPQCCPTRNSFLTGRRPDSTRVFTNGELTSMPVPRNMTSTYFREALPNQVTIPGAFKRAGYYVTGGGKVGTPSPFLSFSQPFF